MVKQKKRSFMSKLFSRRILLLIQFIVSIIFLGCIYILKMLPMKYYLILCGIIFLLWMLSSLLIKSGIKKKKRENKYARLIFGKLLSLILSIALGFVSVMAFKGNNFLSNITSAIAKIENKANKDFQTKDYKDYSLLGDAIMDGDIDVIVADNAYMALLEANHEGIDENLKSLYKVEIQEKLNSVTQETNVTKNPFIVYMTGIDTYGTVSAISRADVNLAVCVSPIQKQILIVSIPRDTQITLHKNGKMDKLTHSAMYGINETISSIEDFLDLKVNYYAKTNFSGITNIIDALGGVTIDSPYEFTTLHGHYHINKGINQMDGDKALCFVRERYALPSGDFDRGRNQQRLLKAMINKAVSPKIITNYSNILQAVEGCFETNMSSEDIKSLVQTQLDDMSKWKMYNVQLTGDPEISYKTYSMKGKKCYTMKPNKKSLSGIINVINKIEDGKRITDQDVKGLQGV